MMCSATLSRINSIAGELRSASMNVAVLEFGHDQLVTVVARTMQWSYSPSIAFTRRKNALRAGSCEYRTRIHHNAKLDTVCCT
jgi:hypothetical protein